MDQIIRDFDTIIQTKTNKITFEELNKYVKECCIDRLEFETFNHKATKADK